MENQYTDNRRRPYRVPMCHKWGLILLIAIVNLDLSGIDFPRGMPDLNF
jgi:hypothetical protein